MSRLRIYQFAVIAGFILLLEALCLAGDIGKSLANVLLAFGAAFVIGIATGTILHGYRTARDILDPLFATYYAIPVFAFYPLFIVIFGLGDGPQLLIGFLLGVVAVIVTILNGLDRVPSVLKKTAQISRLSPLQTAMQVTLPFCAP